jgi:hypothetical protein
MGGACSTYGGRGEVHTALWWGNMREGDNLEDLGRRRWENNIKEGFKKQNWGLIRLGTCRSVELL